MHGGLRTGLVALGGAAWIVSSVAHWTSTGNGSTMHGLRLANWLRSSPLRPSWGMWGSTAILFVAFAGCALVATCTLRARPVMVARTAAAGLVLLVVTGLVVLDRFPLRRWDTAPWLVAGGAVLVLAADAVPLRLTLHRVRQRGASA